MNFEIGIATIYRSKLNNSYENVLLAPYLKIRKNLSIYLLKIQ